MFSLMPDPEPIPDSLWPFGSIEINEMAFDGRTFPYEIGFARWRDVDGPIESWATYIRPDARWLDRSSRVELDDKIKPNAKDVGMAFGLTASSIVRRLNAELFGATVCCGGLCPAQRGLDQIFAAAGAKPFFRTMIRSDLEARANPGMAQWLDANDEYPLEVQERAIWVMRAFASGRKRRPERIELP